MQDFGKWGRVGGMTRAARHDPQILANSGQNGLLRRFEREVDPDHTLDPEERLTRVLRLRNAHMIGMSIRAADARTAKRKARVSARRTAAAPVAVTTAQNEA